MAHDAVCWQKRWEARVSFSLRWDDDRHGIVVVADVVVYFYYQNFLRDSSTSSSHFTFAVLLCCSSPSSSSPVQLQSRGPRRPAPLSLWGCYDEVGTRARPIGKEAKQS